MTGLEGPTLKLGGSVASYAVKSWLQRRRRKIDRESTLLELATDELKGPLERRKLENLVETIGLQVAEELKPVLAARYSTLPENEVAAAFLAVEDALGKIDLSDAALLADDADPERLARRVRTQLPDQARSALLSERATGLYELALDQTCRHLVLVVRHLPSFQPATLAEVLKRLSQQSNQLDELLARTPTTSLAAPGGTDHDTEFRAEYLSLLARKLDKLELLGLTMDDQPTLPLTVAYLSLSVSSHRSRWKEEQPELWFKKHPGRRDGTTMRVEDAIGGSVRTLVRGEAGSGKTTLLDWLAVTAARSGFTGKLEPWNGLVPFPIRLRSFTTGELPSPEQFVAHAAASLSGRMPPNWVDRVLRAGRGMILIDGVDEVAAPRRRKVKEWLQELVLIYPSTRFVVTSRTAAADQDWLGGEDFDSVLLEPMTVDDIHALVNKWHEAAALVRSVEKLDGAQRRLLHQFNNRPHLRTLAASPLLCAMLCALNLAHRSELPRDRMDLYRKALSMLLHMRDAERNVGVLLNEQQKQILLGHLAWRLTLGNRVELPVDEVLEHITYRLGWLPHVDHGPQEVLNHLLERSGVLRAPVRGRVDFIHRTFQEFLAASEATETGCLDALIAQAHRDTWRETVIMACGHAKHHQANKLLIGILNRAGEEPRHARRLRLLAAACLETVSNVAPEVIDRVEQVIREHLVPPRSLRETRSLASVGTKLLRYLPETINDLSGPVAAATVRAATLTAGEDALRLLRNYAQDSRRRVQEQLSEAWKYFDPERFAKEVLATSPLFDGSFLITESRLIPYVGLLGNLKSLSMNLSRAEELSDLDLLSGVPVLQELAVTFDQGSVVDLAPLVEHPDLTEANLYFADKYTGMRALRSLQRLRRLTIFRSSAWRGLGAFSGLSKVESLAINQLRSVDSLNALASMESLKELKIWDCSSRALAATRPIVGIRTLLAGGEFGNVDEVARLVETFPNIEILSLTNLEAGDLAPLARLPLNLLQILNGTVGDLRSLATHPTLKQLVIAFHKAPLDVSALADMEIELLLVNNQEVIGLEKLGPGVTLI